MAALKVLDASYNCGIDQMGINGLNLFEINIYKNDKIYDLSFTKTLKKYTIYH